MYGLRRTTFGRPGNVTEVLQFVQNFVIDNGAGLCYTLIRKRKGRASKMNKYVVVEVNFNGDKRVLNGEYTYAEACEVQEAMEWLHDENSYMIYSNDEWVYEVENGRA